MTGLFIVGLFSTGLLVAVMFSWLTFHGMPFARSHPECLRNIDRLERELFPEWFKNESAPPFGFEPAEVWSLQPGAKVYYLPGPLQQLEAENLRIQQALLLYGERGSRTVV